ncbi:IS4 family transposase [Allochromatium tepidum]|uniref:IS4 family transposase n=1 Tax=Allochromatium tepidum TaxID=553982 RepID=UPI003AF6332B
MVAWRITRLMRLGRTVPDLDAALLREAVPSLPNPRLMPLFNLHGHFPVPAAGRLGQLHTQYTFL